MKVLLISANTLRIPYPVYPLGLDYVAGSLDSRYQTKIVDLNDFTSPESLEAMIREFSPDFAGVSIRNIDNTDVINCRSFLPEYQNLMRQIRTNSQAKIILGGSGFTIFPVEFMRELDADYGIVGEGERLSQLLDALEKKADVEEIPGVLTKEKRISFMSHIAARLTDISILPVRIQVFIFLMVACLTCKLREVVRFNAVTVLTLISRVAGCAFMNRVK